MVLAANQAAEGAGSGFTAGVPPLVPSPPEGGVPLDASIRRGFDAAGGAGAARSEVMTAF